MELTINLFQIFMYGGTGHTLSSNPVEKNVQETIDAGLLYVLSLPSFHWQKQDAGTPTWGRYLHTCNIVGQRQMMVVGGMAINSTSGDNGGQSAPDPWGQGIGVFDLSEMQWSDSYNANAPAYTTPQKMKDYIASNGRYPAQWSDDSVKNLFVQQGMHFGGFNF